MFSVSFQKDVPVKTDAGFSVCIGSFTTDPKEERPYMTGGRRKKGVMVGLESADGQV